MQKQKSNVLIPIHFLSIQTLLSCHMVHMTYLTSVKYEICSVIVSGLVMIHAALISCTYLDFGADPVAEGPPCSALIATTVPSRAFRLAHW